MRYFAWSLMFLGGLMLGCAEPTTESTPEVTANSGEGDHDDHDHADHDHGEDGHSHEEGDHDHGDHDHAEGDHDHAEGDHADSHDDSAALEDSSKVRFVADKSLEVSNMMCPYSCWPTVEKTLAQLPGVEGVQLAEQPEGTPEGVIEKRVVELKLSDGFDFDAAIAALGDASFEAKKVN